RTWESVSKEAALSPIGVISPAILGAEFMQPRKAFKCAANCGVVYVSWLIPDRGHSKAPVVGVILRHLMVTTLRCPWRSLHKWWDRLQYVPRRRIILRQPRATHQCHAFALPLLAQPEELLHRWLSQPTSNEQGRFVLKRGAKEVRQCRRPAVGS